MSGQWAADPYGRAQLRYYDGTQWTAHVSNNGVVSTEGVVAPPSVGAPPAFASTALPATAAPKSANGKLIAAGVMEIIQGALGIIFGLWLLSLSQNGIIQFIDGAAGGAITLIAIIMLVIGGSGLAAAIGCLKGRPWGIITTIVLQSIGLVLFFVGLVNGGNDGNPGGALVAVAYIVTVLGLAIAGMKQQKAA